MSELRPRKPNSIAPRANSITSQDLSYQRELRALIQFRRGTAQEWIQKDPILDSGEPGFETDTGLYKIGDGIHHWSELQYANQASSPLILGDNADFVQKTTVRSAEVNFKVIGETDIFEVPPDFMFLIDSMEVVTKTINNPGDPPIIRFGNSQEPQSYYQDSTIISNNPGSRHVLEIPQNTIYEGTIVTFGISVPSTADSHTGYAIVYGSLIRVMSP
jgi:hypothetical protein